MLIDWSQNHEHKTTVGVYSLRARDRPTVSTPPGVGRARAPRTRAGVRGGRRARALRPRTATCSLRAAELQQELPSLRGSARSCSRRRTRRRRPPSTRRRTARRAFASSSAPRSARTSPSTSRQTASGRRSTGRATQAELVQEDVPFEMWRARAAYYFDPAGNLVELIARERAPGDQLLIEVSEVGLPVADVGAAVEFLESESDLPHFSGDRENFSARRRLLRPVHPRARRWPWLFTDRPASDAPVRVDDRGRLRARAGVAWLIPRHRGSLRVTMVDWSLARQVARLAAGSGDEGPPQADVVALCAEMESHVAAYTGLAPARPIPRARTGRAAPTGSGSTSTRSRRCSTRSPTGSQAARVRGPAGGCAAGRRRGAAGRRGRARDGYMSQRVLGQFELSLLGPSAAAAAVRRAEPAQGDARSGRRSRTPSTLDLRPRAHARRPVPGRRRAARPPAAPAARLPRRGRGADPARRRRRPAVAAGPRAARRPLPRRRAGGAGPDPASSAR